MTNTADEFVELIADRVISKMSPIVDTAVKSAIADNKAISQVETQKLGPQDSAVFVEALMNPPPSNAAAQRAVERHRLTPFGRIKV